MLLGDAMKAFYYSGMLSDCLSVIDSPLPLFKQKQAMARPSAVSSARANPALSSKSKSNKKSRVVSDDSEQESASGTEEATSSDGGASGAEDDEDGRKPAAKRRVTKPRQKDDDDDEDSDENEDASQPKSRSSKAVNKSGAGATRIAKSSSESQGSTASSTASNGVGGAASASVMKPRHPLQPGGSTNAAVAPRSPFRTVSLNDSPSNAAHQNSARRRLSGHRFSAADALRRQSLPSTLRKTAAIAGDGDTSFASSNGASPARPLARPVAGTSAGNAGQLQPIRRTSAGFALQGGGIGALNAAGNALRRNASNTSNGNPAADLTNATLPMPIISAEVMTSNYEEWMKMATDNVGFLASSL